MARYGVRLALYIVVVWILSVPGLALAASPAQTSPVPAPPGLVTPDTKPAVSGQATGATAPTNVTNVTNNNVTLPQMPSVQDFAGGIFTQVLTLLLTGLANALQALSLIHI